ncbi:biotin synthase [Malikia sp.]|uniref:biotin synthase n=1 Tax=Malikia sp. TaxID=2070706 RepID=UPI00261BB018|nr:biotin synthase [Malikia sp.]MDD2730248.1 biotin synthase [Malikia sp.]
MQAESPGQERPVPGLDPIAARRWREHRREASPWLHEEVGARMAERLHWIKQAPARWLDWSPLSGGLRAHRLVSERYPDAKVALAGDATQAAADSLRRQSPRGWNPLKWLASGPVPHDDSPGAAGLLWANMALHQEPLPRALLSRWLELLEVDGFLMFSCLGPDSLRELRAVYARQGWPAPTHAYTDMHDWGDMLVEVGFAEPVMAMERITLSYPDAGRLLRDLRDWGRNLNQARFAGLRGRRWKQQLEQAIEAGLPRDAQGQLLLSFEVIYGHAVKPKPRVRLESTSTVSVDQMRSMLRQPRT